MEPVRAVQNAIPGEFRGVRLLNRRMRAVVNAYAAALRRALFQIIHAHAVAAAHDFRRVHAEIAQCVHRRLADRVLRQLRHISRIHADIGQRYRHVRLAAAKRRLHPVALKEPLIAHRGQTKHDFSKRYHPCHADFLPLFLQAAHVDPRPTAAVFLRHADKFPAHALVEPLVVGQKVNRRPALPAVSAVHARFSSARASPFPRARSST